MGFYGIKNDYNQEIGQLSAKIEELKERKRREEGIEKNDLEMPPINIRVVGETITQALISGKFVLSCINSYLQR